ncbi:LAMI_0E05798g1_1 [Lachancea mirantina]|uniref:LAMI_0E05798g1_1 n=1 Tax=Lachancea mirantina TaxID=1230905 RepID=A0A1G4JLC7_9SACH|nr:LAMI_0E05798g1_1 [Lachancea mirantina]
MPSTSELDTSQYGVVIDAGSSGSRVYVYQWQDSHQVSLDADNSLAHSVPKILRGKDWTFKTSPGLSSFKKSPEKAYNKHIKPLLEFAGKVVPHDKIHSTPIFIQATAGMRLLPEKYRNKIMGNLCTDIKKDSDFRLLDCENQIQVIDGETEGLYGWLALNYMMGNFDNYSSIAESHFSSGFMDMGGASAQLAFQPSNQEEITKHDDDIATVSLKSINGEFQQWRVFVSTWLGFGANQARSRYLAQLINSLPENSNDDDGDDFQVRRFSDPCMLKGSTMEVKFKGKEFELTGSGNYEQCSKSIYPLLLKHMPCLGDPCLFNGVHAPTIDFYKDMFVGVSEYWYTANDVFKLGGEYNFYDYSKKVREFCETDWEEVEQNSADNLYNKISTKQLSESCFKANWIMNVLHEGFNMPRVGLEVESSEEMDSKPKTHSSNFRSLNDIEGEELSWTLGRILLYASSLVMKGTDGDRVGLKPSSNDMKNLGKLFVTGGISGSASDHISAKSGLGRVFGCLVVLLLLCFVMIKSSSRFWTRFRNLPRFSKFLDFNYSKLRQKGGVVSLSTDLERGNFERGRFGQDDDNDGVQVRSRSMINLRGNSANQGQFMFQESSDFTKNGSSSHSSKQKLRSALSLADFKNFINA